MPVIATTPLSVRYSRRVPLDRQLLAIGEASRTTNPASCGPLDSTSSTLTP